MGRMVENPNINKYAVAEEGMTETQLQDLISDEKLFLTKAYPAGNRRVVVVSEKDGSNFRDLENIILAKDEIVEFYTEYDNFVTHRKNKDAEVPEIYSSDKLYVVLRDPGTKAINNVFSIEKGFIFKPDNSEWEKTNEHSQEIYLLDLAECVVIQHGPDTKSAR